MNFNTQSRFGKMVFALVLTSLAGQTSLAAEPPPTAPVTFNFNFEGASLGTIEKLDEAIFRCHVMGQYDERGRNRQTSWYYFRMDHVKGRDVVLTLVDLVGEYNDRPGACPMGPDIVPVFSDDGHHWHHFPGIEWDGTKKEMTIKFHADQDTVWIAHIPPYTPSDLQRLLSELRDSPHVLSEWVGKTVQGREIPMVTVTNRAIPDGQKKTIWLQARQHAWEAGTSYVVEGAMRFVVSDDPAAIRLRDRIIFRFTPMIDLDGCANGKVRFNANNYDVNRHWAMVDLRQPELLKLMPEIWYTKKAIVAAAGDGRGIDLMVNLHNTETNEYMATQVDDPILLKRMTRFQELLTETSYDPSRPLVNEKLAADDTNSLFPQHKVPVLLMEQRIGTSKKLGRRPTVEDRLAFGKQLIIAMARAALGE